MARAKTAAKYSLTMLTAGNVTATELKELRAFAKTKNLSLAAFVRVAAFKAAGVTPTYERKSWDHCRAKA